jgi:hypothetical protein
MQQQDELVAKQEVEREQLQRQQDRSTSGWRNKQPTTKRSDRSSSSISSKRSRWRSGTRRRCRTRSGCSNLRARLPLSLVSSCVAHVPAVSDTHRLGEVSEIRRIATLL